MWTCNQCGEHVEEQFDAYIVPNNKAVITDETDTYIIVRIDLKYGKVYSPLVKWLKPRDHKKYQLYGLSMEIYKKIIGGQLQTRDLIYWLRDNKKLSFYEARNLILQFTGDLMQKGLVVIEAK